MRQKIVVLGSNSFSGAHMVDHALMQGLEVAGISRSSEPSSEFLPYSNNPELGSGFQFHAIDIRLETARLIDFLDAFKPDYVINFAAQGMVAESWLHPEQWFETNLVAAVKLHEYLRGCDYLKRFVQISTPEVYGNCHGQVDEGHPYNPSTPYAVSKAACDMSLATYYRQYKFPVITTRAANVYGPGQQLYRVIPKTILGILKGVKLPLHGGGSSVRSFIHIRDVVDATLKLAYEGISGSVYHLATDRYVSIRQLIEMICDSMNVSFEQQVEIVGDRAGKDSAYLLNTNRMKDELNWSPSITLEQGIQETIEWVKGNFDSLSGLPVKYVHQA